MIRFLTVDEVLEVHRRMLQQTGGAAGVRDRGAVQSAVAQPQMTFAGEELYPTMAEKAAALGYSLVCNHPFVDGNKRVGHAAMELFLVLNGWELTANVDDQERFILDLAAGSVSREQLVDWIRGQLRPMKA